MSQSGLTLMSSSRKLPETILNVFRSVARRYEAHEDETADHLTALAFAWLLETSTDPTVHADALQVVPELRWPRRTISQLPLSLLDTLLDRLIECFYLDFQRMSHLGGSSRQSRVVALSTAFLWVYWERCTLNPEEIWSWTVHSGFEFRRSHPELLELLSECAERCKQDENHQDWVIVTLMYLTLRRPVFYIGSGASREPFTDFRFQGPLTTKALCRRTLLHLTQAINVEQMPVMPGHDHLRPFFTLVDPVFNTSGSSSGVLHMRLLTFAMLLGYQLNDNVVDLNYLETRESSRIRAAEYVLAKVGETLVSCATRGNFVLGDQIFRFGLKRNNEKSESESNLRQMARLVEQLYEELLHLGFPCNPRLPTNYLRVCHGLCRISSEHCPNRLPYLTDFLRSGIHSASSDIHVAYPLQASQLSNSWRLSGDDLPWLLDLIKEYVSAIHDTGEGCLEPEKIWTGIADALLCISTIDRIILKHGYPPLGKVIRMLVRVCKIPAPHPKVLSSPDHPFIRLQCATLSLISIIVDRIPGFEATSRRIVLWDYIFNWLSYPTISQATTKIETAIMKNPLFVRDMLFMDVVAGIADLHGETWLHSTKSNVFLHQSAKIFQRWMIPKTPVYPFNRAQGLSASVLLRCPRVHYPTSEEWGTDLSCVHQAAIVAYWVEWVGVSRPYARDPGTVDWLAMIRCIESLGVQDAGAVRWYLEDMLGDAKTFAWRFSNAQDELLALKEALTRKIMDVSRIAPNDVVDELSRMTQ
ncbi:hypothetical protein EIP91_002079 [Steccherinum ochraceum]|uniref:Uncharacterized protein n=1 Tax=Steccherinum ochraceum TaxID=92696 RepID=A0A4R0RTJ1_9APHY|nr:hypothetical protein EIP91_002079 [Steccherinum ochraceum]